VIFAELVGSPGANQVQAAVADVGVHSAVTHDGNRGTSRTHPAQLAIVERGFVNSAIRFADPFGKSQTRVRFARVIEVSENIRRDPACDLTSRVPSHPVRNNRQSAFGSPQAIIRRAHDGRRVFVALPQASDITLETRIQHMRIGEFRHRFEFVGHGQFRK
jgi:hypothetical protein